MKTSIRDMALNALNEKIPVKAALDGTDSKTVLDGAGEAELSRVKALTAGTIQQWAETSDLDDGESNADRLLAMFVGIVDANQDGELDDDDQELLNVVLNSAWDYLTKYGVAEEDANALLSDWDSDAADRVIDLIAASLPSDADADGDIDNFAFGDTDQDAVFDAVAELTMDATYKKMVAFRGGRKVRINKRIAGTVRLTAKQKVAIRKAQMKSHNAAATMRRLKSMRLRKKSGM